MKRFQVLKESQCTEHNSQAKNVVKVALSQTFSEINAFLHFKQTFKIAAKNGGKTIFGKKCQMTLSMPCGPKLS